MYDLDPSTSALLPYHQSAPDVQQRGSSEWCSADGMDPKSSRSPPSSVKPPRPAQPQATNPSLHASAPSLRSTDIYDPIPMHSNCSGRRMESSSSRSVYGWDAEDNGGTNHSYVSSGVSTVVPPLSSHNTPSRRYKHYDAGGASLDAGPDRAYAQEPAQR